MIINSPYDVPMRHWRFDRETHTFDLAEERRPAASNGSGRRGALAALGEKGG